jgi:ketosteroid isomerase-like protein
MNSDVAKIEQHVVQLAALRAAALVNRDSATIEGMLAADFVYTNSSGTVMTREQYLQTYVKSPDVFWHSQELAAVQVRVCDNVAVLTARVHDRATFATGQVLDAHFRTTQVYLHVGHGDWKYLAGHTSSTDEIAKVVRQRN